METSLQLTLIGLVIIFATVGVLLRGKVHPVVAMTVIPLVGAVVAGFGVTEIEEFFSAGLARVINVVVMFIFAIVYFGIMQDGGLFTPIINRLIRATRGHIVYVTLGTAAIAVIAHLDGAGASTFLITIPALLPLYKALHMSRYVLLAIVALSASVMNMVPWGGPTGRAATVIGVSPDEIWRHILPMQITALVLVFVIAAIMGVWETRRIKNEFAMAHATGDNTALKKHESVDVNAIADEFLAQEAKEREEQGIPVASRNVKIFNIVLTVVAIGALVGGIAGPAFIFILATAIALMVNYRNPDDQAASLKRHAPAALSMAGVLLAAAMFLGILDGSGMLDSIAVSLVNVMPESVGPYLHIIVGLLGVPLDLMTSTDAYYFSVLPIVEQTAAAYGVSSMGVVSALLIGNIIGTFVSPFSPALWLGIGLAEANMGKHIKVTFPIAWAFSVVMVLIAWFTGVLA